MSPEQIIQIIQDHALTVRCLPHVVVERWSHNDRWTLQEGDELEYWKPTMDYFMKVTTYGKQGSQERKNEASKRLKKFYETFPDGRAIVKRTRQVEHAGWWYVKQTKNTDSTVRFSRKYDKFLAPTLEEAIKLYLISIGHESN